MNTETRRVRLRPAEPDDYPALHSLEDDPASLGTWRYRGQLPPLEQYEERLWEQTVAIHVVESQATGELLGYCQLYDMDPRSESGWFSVYAAAGHRGNGLVMEGNMVFLEWAFANWPVRWLHAHCLAANYRSFASTVRRGECHDLGVLEGRAILEGEPHDVHVVGFERELWLSAPVRRRAVASMAAAARAGQST